MRQRPRGFDARGMSASLNCTAWKSSIARSNCLRSRSTERQARALALDPDPLAPIPSRPDRAPPSPNEPHALFADICRSEGANH